MAGSFYPHDKEGLIESIRQSFLGKLGPGEYPESIFFQGKKSGSIGCFIVPHAGYVYSGQVAAHSYFKARENLGKVEEELTVIILGPNHY